MRKLEELAWDVRGLLSQVKRIPESLSDWGSSGPPMTGNDRQNHCRNMGASAVKRRLGVLGEWVLNGRTCGILTPWPFGPGERCALLVPNPPLL
jgi:hypothetical protein